MEYRRYIVLCPLRGTIESPFLGPGIPAPQGYPLPLGLGLGASSQD